jgi:hypothetical protein
MICRIINLLRWESILAKKSTKVLFLQAKRLGQFWQQA